VGVDIDDALVRMAWRRRRTLWSHQAPSRPVPTEATESFACHPTGTDSASRPKRKRVPHQPVPPPAPPEADHFPASCQHMFGPLPIPPSGDSNTGTGTSLDLDVSQSAFPHNVSFRRADWVNERIPEDEAGHDVIIA
jgi:7SK snRNA methylphosphate capping enzyme